MQLPRTDASSAIYLIFVYHFEGAVEGWSDAEIISEDQRKAIAVAGALVSAAGEALRVAAGKTDAAERIATRLRARFGVRDAILDMRVMGLADAVYNGPAMRNRNHPDYKSVFQEGTAGDVTETRMRDEPEVAERVLGRYDKLSDFTGKQRPRDDLETAIQKSYAARDALDEAEMAENKAGDAEISARLEVRKALEQGYGMLRTAFPGQRRMVESFFLKRERSDKKDEGGDEPGNGGVDTGNGGSAKPTLGSEAKGSTDAAPKKKAKAGVEKKKTKR